MITPQWLATQFAEMEGFAQLGEGGQKWVYSAVHPVDGQVVLKLIKPNQNAQRIEREILAVQEVRSARVPAVKAAGSVNTPVGTCIWLREQLVSGKSVREVLSTGMMPYEDVERLALHILEALADVEKARIVHRDVKPDNIMQDADGSFWLLDFGIARHLDLNSLTATNAFGAPHTLGYAPREQFRNLKREVDSRADLFALAVTLVECLTGIHPFRNGARDAMEVVRRVETVPLVAPEMSNARGAKFSELINTMGQRRIDCRPTSAAEALAWMRDVVDGPPPA